MALLIGLAVLSVIGIGAVFWLLKNESEDEAESLDGSDAINLSEKTSAVKQQDYTALIPKSSKMGKMTYLRKLTGSAEASSTDPEQKGLLGGILKKFNFGKKNPEDEIPDITPLPSLKEYLNAQTNKSNQSNDNEVTTQSNTDVQTGTASIKTSSVKNYDNAQTLSKEDEKSIEKEVDLLSELHEIKKKYEKLDALFSEKGVEFDKIKASLDNELKNRKEFNKVKDLLEKELKDTKDKTRHVEIELSDSKTECEDHKKRVVQLEEKAAKLEKELLLREDKINTLERHAIAMAESSAKAPGIQETTTQEVITPPPPVEPKNEPPEPQTGPEVETPNAGNTIQEETPQPLKTDIELEIKNQSDRPQLTTEITLGPNSPEMAPHDKEEKREGPNEPVNQDQLPIQKDGFTLNLKIDETSDEEPDSQPKDEPFLKLQPDVISGEQKPGLENSPSSDSEPQNKEPSAPPLNPSDSQDTNQQENNNTNKKE